MLNKQWDKARNTNRELVVCPLTGGYSTSGVVFKKIQDKIQDIRWRGGLVDRVVLDDITVWENLCPFIKDDPTFVNTLVDLLQRNGLTVLATHTTHDTDIDSYAQQSLVEVSDTNLELSLVNNQGFQRILIRAKRSRNADRIRESFELKVGDEIEIEKAPSLLRLGANGRFEHIPICFFIQVESTAQDKYYSEVIEQLKACLATTGYLAPYELLDSKKSFSSGRFAATDELQILQLDEFQLQNAKKAGLHRFNLEDFGKTKFSEFDVAMRQKGLVDDNTVCAFPFYDNFSCLAASSELLNRYGTSCKNVFSSWDSIVDVVTEIRSKEDIVVFDFPSENDENLNCLFLEIFFEKAEWSEIIDDGFFGILDHNHFAHAVRLLIRLCWGKQLKTEVSTFSFDNSRQATERDYWKERIDAYSVQDGAMICRHWFSTLREMYSNCSRKKFASFSLPGNVTTAGQWYLGIPSHSAVPQVGLELISMLTSSDEELKRLRMGVGLPARQNFFKYKKLSESGTYISDDGLEFFRGLKHACDGTPETGKLHLGKRPTTIKRSELQNYYRCSPLLASFLRNMIREVSLDRQGKPKGIGKNAASETQKIRGAAKRLKNNCLALLGGQ